MAKKKYLSIYLSIYYMFLLVALFVICLGLFSNCYALTSEEVTDFLTDAREFFVEKQGNSFNASKFDVFSTYYTNKFTDFDYLAVGDNGTNQYMLVGFNISNIVSCYYDSITPHFRGKATEDTPLVEYLKYYNSGNTWYNERFSFPNSTANEINLTYINFGINYCFTNTQFYDSFNSTTEYTGNNFFTTAVPQNSITLVAAKSDYKFTFHDKDQLNVYFTGEWTPADFTFYVERYINNDWQQFSDSNDWLELFDFDNPYYIFWRNLNYYPAGTYRYCALLGNNPEQSYYSDSFEIYDSFIDNSATGIVDSNGDIDINIDTGKTVDSIKDYLGESPQTTQNEIEDSFPQVDIEDPTHNFFAWIFEEIEDIFTTTEDRTFTFSLYTANSYTIHSNDVSVPPGVVKTLVGLSVDFGICYYILRDIHKTIEKVKKGSFEQIAEEDITANMV